MLALLAEALLVLLVLTLGSSIASRGRSDEKVAVVRFKAASEQQQQAAQADDQKADLAKPQQSSPKQAEPEEARARPELAIQAPPPQLIRISPLEMAASDIAALPRSRPPAPSTPRASMGPADPSPPAPDSARVSGSGPDGEPLYAASWYREPYDDELTGYLSTATGPGWGLIACRTVPDYRVDDCVAVDEYPSNSNIARAVLAAAWQFRVRPPRIGGQPKIGEWVRIRIDYGMRQSRAR